MTELSTFQTVVAWTVSAFAGFTCFLFCSALLGVLFPWVNRWLGIK